MRLSELQSKINRIAPTGDIEISPTQVADPLSGEVGYQVDNFSEVIDTLSPLTGFSWFSVDEATFSALENEYASKASPVVLTQTHFTHYQNLVNRLNQARDLARVSDVLSLAVEEQDPYSVYFKVPENVSTPDQFSEWHERMAQVLKIVAGGGRGTFKLSGTEQGSIWFGWLTDLDTYLLMASVLKIIYKAVRYRNDNPVDDASLEALVKVFRPETAEEDIPEAVRKLRQEQYQSNTEKDIKEQQEALQVHFEARGVTVSVSAVGRGVNVLMPEVLDNGQEVRLSWKRPKYIKGSDEELDIALGEVDIPSLSQSPKQLPQGEERDNE